MHRVIEWGGWFVAGFALWLATASAITVGEVIAAAAASAVCAVLGRLARRSMGVRVALPVEPLRWFLLVPAGAVLDLVRLVGWLLEGAREDVASRQFSTVQVGGGDEPATVVRRAGAILAISATPGTVVVDADPGSGTALLHPLVTGWPDLDRRVAR